MNAADLLQQLLTTMQALTPVLLSLSNTIARSRISSPWSPRVSYTNVSLSLTVKLLDARGRRAQVIRKQRVRFLTKDAGVISVPIWGAGKVPTSYRVSGARYQGVRRQGPSDELLLALPRASEARTEASIVGRRTISKGFIRQQEYFESRVERPTQRLRMVVVFPKGRVPRAAYLVETPGRGASPVRTTFNREGAPQLAFSRTPAKEGTLYSLRWTW